MHDCELMIANTLDDICKQLMGIKQSLNDLVERNDTSEDEDNVLIIQAKYAMKDEVLQHWYRVFCDMKKHGSVLVPANFEVVKVTKNCEVRMGERYIEVEKEN